MSRCATFTALASLLSKSSSNALTFLHNASMLMVTRKFYLYHQVPQYQDRTQPNCAKKGKLGRAPFFRRPLQLLVSSANILLGI